MKNVVVFIIISDKVCGGTLRCRDSSICVSQQRLCDGVAGCPYRDDELFCSTSTSNIRTLLISNTDQPFSSKQYQMLTYLNVSSSNFQLHTESLRGLHNLLILDLSSTDIQVLPRLVFQDLARLEQIVLDGNNQLQEIQSLAFFGLKSLTTLKVTDTRISKIYPSTFEGLDSLLVLNLSRNLITNLMGDSFIGLSSLQILDLRHNPVKLFIKEVFLGLTSLSELYSDVYLLCCLKPTSVAESSCFPQKNEFSSCDDLMRNEVLRAFLWLIGLIALLGNTFALIYRILLEMNTFKTANGVLLTNLCVSDFLMGVYLVIIAGTDMTYRGSYIWNDIAWRESVTCKIAGK